MGFFGWIILGLASGAIARLIIPGKQTGGWISTLILGVVGAFVGGLVGSWVFHVGLSDFYSIRTWVLAILGALGVTLAWQRIRKSK